MRVERLRSSQWVAVIAGALLAVALAGVLACLLALSNLSSARELLVDRIDPAQSAALRLSAAMVNEETGVRGYALAGSDAFLEPYRRGNAERLAALSRLNALAAEDRVRSLRDDIRATGEAIEDWRVEYAEIVIAAVGRDGPRTAVAPTIAQGKVRFDVVRRRLATLQSNLNAVREESRHRLSKAATTLLICVIIVGALLVGAALITGLTLRRVVGRPLDRLVRQIRTVAGGEWRRPIVPSGPRDMMMMGRDVELMRERIVTELDTMEHVQQRLEDQARDLERSNAELEQFAYVASHDLQEPLRKVASFCQALERRYSDQLDDRARQYIDFAVDGAKRMQVLINDLLAFSRVGRAGAPLTPVATGEVVAQALRNLESAIEQEGAEIMVPGDLPTLHGDASLLTLLFQNLVGNGIKFRGDDPPVVRISARRDGEDWLWTVADNGIGIDPSYAERIFIIFQRLHNKEAYAGTGIGLSMCRKIVEHHGGRIWLATPEDDAAPRPAGTTFHFTIPIRDDQENA